MDTTKIIKGVVNSGRYTVTAPIIKEDYGLYLQIEGVELPQTYEVDFSNSENSGTSVTMIGNSDGVLIPRQFIDTGKDIFAFLYHVGANYGRTVYKFRIPNKCRPDRTEETPTPEEQSVIDQAISALNDAVAQTAQDVIDADASERMALGYAESAQESARQAQEYSTVAISNANSASQSASQASASATASAQSASEASQIKSDIEDMVDDAQASATASANSATASANSASQASTSAQSASASASSASQSASSAQTSASTASTKASEASTSASTASAKATESAQSASQALTYKTDAESAKGASQTAQGLAESARDSAVQAKNDAESAKADAESARDEAQQAVASISGALDEKAPVITDTASGSIASFSDGADNLPLKSLIVDINPVQDLHGQENPYPAGSTANQLDLIAATYARCTLVDVYTGSVRLNITSNYFAAIVFRANAIPTAMMERILNSEPITFELDNNDGYSNSIVVYGTRSNGSNYQECNGYNNLVTITPTLFTAVTSIEFRFQRTGTQHTDTTTVMTGLRVSYGDTATTFQPYENLCPISGWTSVDVNHSDADMTNPTTITIDLGQTVYGGKLDVLSGVLTVDKASFKVSDVAWTRYSTEGNYKFYHRPSNIKTCANTRTNGSISSAYPVVPFNDSRNTPNTFSDSANSTGRISVHDSEYTSSTVEEFVAGRADVRFVYPLATPITVQLSPTEVKSLLGQNNIFADTGDSAVEYRADTKLYIERLTAPDSADMIADANITSGQYFMVGNNLFKATANIANGGAIMVGTNCTRVSLAQALNEINA